MTIRERIERQEHEILSPLASFADQSRGRANPEAERDSRTCFQRDTDRIIHSKAFAARCIKPRSSSSRRATTTAPA